MTYCYELLSPISQSNMKKKLETTNNQAVRIVTGAIFFNWHNSYSCKQSLNCIFNWVESLKNTRKNPQGPRRGVQDMLLKWQPEVENRTRLQTDSLKRWIKHCIANQNSSLSPPETHRKIEEIDSNVCFISTTVQKGLDKNALKALALVSIKLATHIHGWLKHEKWCEHMGKRALQAV
jgi:hypothetical protein